MRRRLSAPSLLAPSSRQVAIMNTNPISIAPPPPGVDPRRSGGYRLQGGFTGDPGGGFNIPTSGGGGGGNWYDPIVDRGVDWLGNRLFGSGGGGSSGGTGAEGTGTCTAPYVWNETLGQCVKPGTGGAVQRFLPGGQTGTMADAYGDAVVGAFGTPALVPQQVGTRQRSDGSTGPILKCPPGAVLGRDNLCYQKGSIPRQFRKWKPTPKAPVSAHDAKMMRKYGPGGSKQAGVKKLATSAGFTCRKR